MAKLGELAALIGAELVGDPDYEVTKVAPLDLAKEGELSFLYDKSYRCYLPTTQASAVILKQNDKDDCPVFCLICANPYLAYARAAAFLNISPPFIAGIHPTALVDPSAEIDESAYIGPSVVIDAGVNIGACTYVGPACYIASNARIGGHTKLVARVTVLDRVIIGNRCTFKPGAVIGAAGFGMARDEQGVWINIPQTGSVHIGDDVDIGANTTVDRGALSDTVIEDGVKLDNQIQIGHNCFIGAHTAVAGCAGISGSTIIGKRCIIGGGVGIAGHLEIVDDVIIKAAASITKSIMKPGVYSSVWPAKEDRDWKKRVARFNRITHPQHQHDFSEPE